MHNNLFLRHTNNEVDKARSSKRAATKIFTAPPGLIRMRNQSRTLARYGSKIARKCSIFQRWQCLWRDWRLFPDKSGVSYKGFQRACELALSHTPLREPLTRDWVVACPRANFCATKQFYHFYIEIFYIRISQSNFEVCHLNSPRFDHSAAKCVDLPISDLVTISELTVQSKNLKGTFERG
jgi:hypothetical protein